MASELTNHDIQNALLYDRDIDLLSQIERVLRTRLSSMDDGMAKADLTGLLLIATLRKNLIETDYVRALLDQYIALVRSTARELLRMKKST